MNKFLLILSLILFQASALMAGPGGKIAKEVFDSPLGKILAVILFVVFLPLILRMWYRERKAVSATKNKLSKMSGLDYELFDEINLKNRVTDVFMRVHKAWSERNLDECDDFMTHWYQQNQQTVFLDEWDKKGMMNICTINKINSVKPIHLRVTDQDNYEGSRVMYLINANIEDYLVSSKNSSIVEGKKGFNDVQTIWTMKLVDRSWKLDNIDQSVELSTYLKMESQSSDSIIERLVNQNA